MEKTRIRVSAAKARSSQPVHFRARILHWNATRVPAFYAALGRLAQPLAYLAQPVLAPLQRGLLRQDAARGVVRVALADALRAELRQQLVELLSAEVEGLGVGAVAQPEHAVAHARQVGPLRLQVLVQRPGVVGHIALAVGGGADQEHALPREDGAVEAVH